MIEERRLKLLRQLERLEKEPGATEYINIGDAEEAETEGYVEHVAGADYRLTPKGRALL